MLRLSPSLNGDAPHPTGSRERTLHHAPRYVPRDSFDVDLIEIWRRFGEEIADREGTTREQIVRQLCDCWGIPAAIGGRPAPTIISAPLAARLAGGRPH